jgi:predicted RNA-binding protein with RPS1 domain
MADRFVRDPHEVVTVGDIVRVWVMEVDKQRRRVSLTMIPPGHDRSGPRRHARPEAPARSQEQRPPQQARPEERGSRESQAPREHRRPDRSRPPDRSREQRPPRSADRGPARPPKPRPITPITDEMKTGKEPMRSFSDLIQFYGLKSPPGGKDQGRGRGDQDSRGKDAGRRKEPPRSSPEPESKDTASQPATQTPPAGPETSVPDSPRPQSLGVPDMLDQAPPAQTVPSPPEAPPDAAEFAPAPPEMPEPAETKPDASALEGPQSGTDSV